MSSKLRFNQLQNSAINYDERGGCCCRPGARLLPSGLRSTRTAENHALPGTLLVWVGGIVGRVARSKGQSALSSAEFRLAHGCAPGFASYSSLSRVSRATNSPMSVNPATAER